MQHLKVDVCIINTDFSSLSERYFIFAGKKRMLGAKKTKNDLFMGYAAFGI